MFIYIYTEGKVAFFLHLFCVHFQYTHLFYFFFGILRDILVTESFTLKYKFLYGNEILLIFYNTKSS